MISMQNASNMVRKKKLLIAVDTFYPKMDGVTVFLGKIIPVLSKDYEITIIAPKFSKDIPPIEHVNLIVLDVSKRIAVTGYSSIKFSLKNRKRIIDAVRNADIIWSQDLAAIGAAAIWYGKKYKKPVLNYVHQITWEQFAEVLPIPYFVKKFVAFFVRAMVRYLYNRCDLLIIPYPALADELKAKQILSKTETATLGVNTNRFQPATDKNEAKAALGIPPDMTVLGYCGRISREKDLNTLKKAYIRLKLKYNKLILLIVGDGPKQEVDELTNVKGIKATGFVDDIAPYLQAMDIFVMPSLTETTSLATIEAMSSGLPVVVTKVGYMQEYVKNRQNGLTFTKENDYLLAKKIELLLEDPHLAKDISRRARETAVLKFSWASTVMKIKEILEKF